VEMGEREYCCIPSSCVNTIHLLCGRKNSAAIFWPEIHSRYPQRRGDKLWIAAVRKQARGRRPGCYPSTVCSSDRPALRRLLEAIDQLEADRGVADSADLEARIAALWSMVSEIDPELARLASGYRRPAG
jgi:hypothetical protein